VCGGGLLLRSLLSIIGPVLAQLVVESIL